MPLNNLESKIREYREMKRLAEEAAAHADAIADEIKAVMTEAGQEKMIVGEYKLSYTQLTRKDIDKKSLAADHPDIAAAYTKESTYRKFLVS